MTKKVLLATEKPFAAQARDQVVAIIKEAGFEAVLLESYQGKEPLLKAVTDADAIIVRSDIIDAEVLGAAKKLALVVRAGAGYDNIDCATAKQKGVAVMNTPGQNANAVGELALGLMLYMARSKFSGKSGTELRGKTLGCHAIGATGRALAGAAIGIGMKVLAFDPYVSAEGMRSFGVEPVEKIEDLYKRCDYVSLHMPANKETKKSIGRQLMSLMPKKACLVNTARAELIDEEQLLAVLEERKDLRYASDVEPTAPTAAVIKEKFQDRVYWTPKKMGAQTEEANVNAGLAAARQIVGFFTRGEKQFIVNP
jgi:D-3-phosphoglycerate dehydrogenase / 2-oxoglutarate reductase